MLAAGPTDQPTDEEALDGCTGQTAVSVLPSPRQVVAFVELRPCTLAALHHAATIAGGSDSELVVVYVEQIRQGFEALSLWTPPLIPDALGIESAVFARAAGILAPTGRPWSFVTAATADEAARVWRTACSTDAQEACQATLVHVCHRRGHRVCKPRDPLRRALTKLGTAPPPVQVVDCATPPSSPSARPHSPHG